MKGKNTTPLVSVIVPVYNGEQYLRECIDSIVAQTYDNIEIICVNDGSTDGSLSLIEEYSHKDDRIIVIDKERGRLQSARNAGLDNAGGDYILFVDADDVVHCQIVELLLKTATEKKLKVVCSNFTSDLTAFENGKKYSDIGNTEEIDGKEALRRQNASDCLRYVGVWGKLFAKELFREIRFYVGLKYSGDNSGISKIYYLSDEVCFSDRRLYYYRRHPKQITAQLSLKHIDCIRVAFMDYDFFLSKKEDDIANMFLVRGYKNLLALRYNFENYSDKNTALNARPILNDLYKKYSKRLAAAKIKPMVKFIIIFMWHCKWVYYLFRKVLASGIYRSKKLTESPHI